MGLHVSQEWSMKQSLQQNQYAVFSLEVEKSETRFTTAKEIIDYLQAQINTHETATFIAIFDHYAHTQQLPQGQIADEIIDAMSIIFCFGITLPSPDVMAVRPRSIGVTEMEDKFLITFIEAPMPVANITMEEWVKAICNR
jgi:dimeric dUTPase (all-alpha-NTP-PPase superfamily)